jgi:hypothetical protein
VLVLIDLHNGRAALGSLVSRQLSAHASDKEPEQFVEFLTALVKCGSGMRYKLETDQLVLEVRLSGASGGRFWIH